MDEAILVATLGLLAERGYADLTVADVARRAGVSKPALYRRWSDKAQLVVEAMVSRLPQSALPDTGSTRGDLVTFTDQLVATFTRTPAGNVLPGLVAAIAADPELAASYRELLVGPLRRRMRAAILRGIDRGDLLRTTDVEFALDALAGPLYVRLLITGASIDPAYSRDAVDLVLARYGATGTPHTTTTTVAAASGRRPTRKDHA